MNSIQKIVDLHTCIQGEGRDSGIPAILIRLTGCNMNCQFTDGICDSAYTSWNPEEGKYSLNDIIKLIEANPQIKYAFITGGNPTFNPDLTQEILFVLKHYGFYTAIEDNGTMYAPLTDLDFVTLSPKLKNSTPRPGSIIYNEQARIHRKVTQRDMDIHEKYRTRYNHMKHWISNYDYQLKFVISDLTQLNEVRALINHLQADKTKVYLMPEGQTVEQLNTRRKWLVETCIREGYKYTDRLHVITYNTKREA